MKPVETEETNFTYKLAGGTEENDLPCVREPAVPLRDMVAEAHGSTTSFWQPEEGDDLDGADAIYVQLQVTRRKVEVGFGDTVEEAELEERALTPAYGGWQTNVHLGDEQKKWLRNGGHFVLRIAGHPTPPVSLWLDTVEEE